jgi:predicted transcriptional regulator
MMPPSKLDRYLSILKVLILGPQKIDSIAYGAKMQSSSLKRYLNFLVSNGLVEERRRSGKRVVYAINERGLSVFETFRALKYLDKLKKTLLIVEEAREVASVPTKHSQKGKEG